ncbi:MAG: ABC transporter substrate-binding protein, partial [bacterium]
MKKLVLFASVLLFGLAVVSCGETTTVTTTATPIVVQGVTDTTVKVGNTAATSGAYAGVGVPFNEGIKAVFAQVNAAGGIDGRTIQFVTYDDTFNAATGKGYTEDLIYEDQVFALVGHFGTPTVGATLDIIQEVGIPMVYAATGINALYFFESVGNPVMAVQPIYRTDGRIMAARAVNESLYGVNGDQALAADAKIGVIYTNDDVGLSIKAGIEEEAAILGKTDDFIYQAITAGTYNAAVTVLKTSGVAAVLLAMNQEPFGYALTSMSNLSLNVPIFTSYVNADVTYVDHLRYNA